MGTVARAVLDHGGHVTGIIPDFLKSRERMLDDVQETIVVSDMHTRKKLMFDAPTPSWRCPAASAPWRSWSSR